jgi:hypothetical protein
MGMTRLLAALVVISAPAGLRAHALEVDARISGGRVVITAMYSDGSPATDAAVRFNSIHIGVTDSTGQLRLDCPAPGTHEVVVDAANGHLARRTIVVPEGPLPDGLPLHPPGRPPHVRTWAFWAVPAGLIAIAVVFANRRTPSRS